MKKILLLFILAISFSCSDDEIDYTEQNDIDIAAYIEKNNLNVQKTSSGLYYTINLDGNGASPSSNSNVTIGYKGYLLNGEVFDQSDNATFNIRGVIAGFGEAVRLLKTGGSGTFILPARLGYGNSGSGSLIKGGDVIVFDINLISFD
ncbi:MULTISPECIES: FKBP-type peptidyl-prolyl cis-trans isomerase [unclassified Polaribacter]|uniref:FKBP-type peptidyl-prolyl cis-trans isomerase n=1 Tax=unclassified Polaribacter TaxID=196858 RepID=UPI0011BEDDC7|nr:MULTISPECIES: FKBP-type peptidyl-prolyl cis-trans isomerase [unclassified Polaribacter]TXD53954.1 peptidylprolyl isomerase [Polaribacter sp. IC063]TXD59663.1 peptidylprolyl isomerase [Polaribacter sp. IC066]